MRVVHITEAFEGGVVEFLKYLTNGTRDIQYTIIYGRHHIYEKMYTSFPENVTFIPWPAATAKISPLKDAKALQALISILKKQKPFDIVHLHSAKAGILGRIAARIVNQKAVIYTPHGATFLRKDVSVISRNIFMLIEKAITVFPGKVVGVSKSEADVYKKAGIKSLYINNGKSFNSFIKKEFNKDNFTIVTTGRIMPQKNPALFNKIALAFINNPKIKFLWVGDGNRSSFLTSPNIKITGWLNSNEVEKLLCTAHLYISTALWEGLSYSVLEAMSVKLPLLLNNCSGNIDLIQNDVNGFLFNNETEAINLINQYYNNRELLAVHGQASFNILQSGFSATQMINKYKELYRSMLRT